MLPNLRLWSVVGVVALCAPWSCGAGGQSGLLLPGGLRRALEAALAGLAEPLLPEHVQDGEEFEYVVVGAGAAGSAVAARLVQAGHRVLLMEAGDDAPPLAKVPMAAMSLLGSTADWQYRTIPNNVSCLGSKGGQCHFSSGRAVGGSTAINYMMYTRGGRDDYDLQVPGWTWPEVEPYFLRAEGLRDLALLPDSSAPYHNTKGKVRVGFCPDPGNEWHSRIFNGLRDLGFPLNSDVNAVSQIGVSRVVTYTVHGYRETSATAYLYREDVRHRLRIAKNTHCTGVVLNEDNVAVGVTSVRRSGRRMSIRATTGVVLSAGAVATPHLLQLSGIGPASLLRAHSIPIRVDLPVGENLSDHVLPLIFIRADHRVLSSAFSLGASVVQYAESRNGPLASIGLTDITAFANTSCYNVSARRLEDGPGCDRPTLQLINAYIPRGTIDLVRPLVTRASQLNDEIISQLGKENAARALLVASPVVLAPKSRGWVRLRTKNPLEPPDIFPNYLADEQDVEEMLRSITILEHLVETPAYRDFGASIVRLKLPGCPTPAASNYWRCYVRQMTFSVYHAVGTCGLGKVLDPRLGVRGVKALHVADLSALPEVPRGNTAAAAYMLGERLADFLLQDKTSDV